VAAHAIDRADDAEVRSFLESKTVWRVAGTLVLSLLYAPGFEFLGYIAASILYLGALLLILNGLRRWRLILTVAVAYSVVTYLLITQLTIWLPTGTLFESLGL
jgi:hypothetical protein